MLSQSYYHIFKKIKQQNPNAIFYAVSRWKFRYIKADEWNNNFIWLKELAPSEELRKDYKEGNIDWDTYKIRFLQEMDNPVSKETMRRIAEEAKVKDVFLFCHCGTKEGEHCHRFLLIDLINEM